MDANTQWVKNKANRFRSPGIGIRMAIGADRRKTVRMVLRQDLKLGAIGATIGLVASVFACRLLTSALWLAGLDRVNPLMFPAIALPLLAISGLAAWAPARRASLVDPMRALREE